MEAEVLFGSLPDWLIVNGGGYGDGYGGGSGYGGYGGGYGDGGYGGYNWLMRFKEFEAIPRVQELWESVSFGYWWSDKDGKPSNGGSCSQAAHVGMVQEVNGPLKLCTSRALHATLNPDRWTGKRLWLVALFGEVQTQDDKMGALKREILAEVSVP